MNPYAGKKTGLSPHAPVLVTGGAGFIGSHTVDALLAVGCEVRVLDDLSSGKRLNLPLNNHSLELMIGDVRNFETVCEAMRDMRWCIHLAAQISVPHSLEKPSISALRNIIGFINVLEAARRAQIEKLVYASSAAVYGDPKCVPLAENTESVPINPHGLEKLVDEQYAELYLRLYGMPSLGLRYFNVYGPRQDLDSTSSGVIPKFLGCLINDRQPIIFGDGLQTRDFIHVYDVAQVNLMALAANYCGVCNVARGESFNLIQLLGILCDCLGKSAEPRFASAREGDIRESRGDIRCLKEVLGVNPIWNLADGLSALVTRQTLTAIAVKEPQATRITGD